MLAGVPSGYHVWFRETQSQGSHKMDQLHRHEEQASVIGRKKEIGLQTGFCHRDKSEVR